MMDYVRSLVGQVSMPPGRLRRIGVTAALAGMALVRERDFPEPVRPLARPLFAAAAAGFVTTMTDEVLALFDIDPRSQQGRKLTAGIAAGAFGIELLSRGVEAKVEGSLDAMFTRAPRLGTAMLMGAVAWAATSDLDWPAEFDTAEEADAQPLPEDMRELLLGLAIDEASAGALRAQLASAQYIAIGDHLMEGGSLVVDESLPKIIPATMDWPLQAIWEDDRGNAFRLNLTIVDGYVTDWLVWVDSDDPVEAVKMPEPEAVSIVHDSQRL